MNIQPLPIDNAFLIDLDPYQDQRGAFTRLWCYETLTHSEIIHSLTQININTNPKKGTVRGLHMQKKPFQEAKYVHCLQGALYDVIIDLRPESKQYRQTLSLQLFAEKPQAIYIPKGCAHGFQTLKDHTQMIYLVDASYDPHHEMGIRWDDPSFAIPWPLSVTEISKKDQQYPDWEEKQCIESES